MVWFPDHARPLGARKANGTILSYPIKLANLLENAEGANLYDEIVILDARFAYEYDGGHIRGALNVYLPHQQDELKEMLMEKRRGDRLLIVIHCEFSSHRGPRLHQILRTWDRSLNTYPALHFPEMYILSGGYKEFFSCEEHKRLCTQGYTPMHHPDFLDQCSEAMKLTKSMSTTKMKSLSRSGSSLSRQESSPLFAGSTSSGGHSMPSSAGHSLLSHSANASIGTSYLSMDHEDEDDRELYSTPINFTVSGSPSHRNATSSLSSSGTSPKLGFMGYAPGKQDAASASSLVAGATIGASIMKSSSFAAAFSSSHGRGSIGAASQDSTFSVSTMDTTEDRRCSVDSDDGGFCSETDSHCSSSQSSLHNGWISLASPRDSPVSAAPTSTGSAPNRFKSRLGQSVLGGSVGSSSSTGSSYGFGPVHPKPSTLPKNLQLSFSSSNPDLPAMTMMEVSSSPAPSPSSHSQASSITLPTVTPYSSIGASSNGGIASSNNNGGHQSYGSFGNRMVPSGASATTANIPYGGNGGRLAKPAPYGHSHSVPQLSVPNGLGSRSRTLGMLPSSSARAINSRSTSDLPNWSEKDEDDSLIASGPFTSRN